VRIERQVVQGSTRAKKERQLVHFHMQGSMRTKEGRLLEVVRHFGSINMG
jgi:hypothetical protein